MEIANLQGVGDEPQVEDELVVYTDGSCVGNGTAEVRAGCGVWYGADDRAPSATFSPWVMVHAT